MNVIQTNPWLHPGPPPMRRAQAICNHDRLRFVWRIFAGKNQTRRYGFQCIQCGGAGRKDYANEMSGNYAWVSANNCQEYFDCYPDQAVPYDDDLTQRLLSERGRYWQAVHERRQTEWWDWYNRYLECFEWREKRRKVLERDQGKCQRCGDDATQVHHLTYQRVGYELLTDLISLCDVCHTVIHR